MNYFKYIFSIFNDDNSWHPAQQPNENTPVVFLDKIHNRVAFLMMQDAEGQSTDKLADVVSTNTKNRGGKIVSHKKVNINGNVFVFIDTVSADRQASPTAATMWVTVKNNVGYGFVCGGLQTNDLAEACGMIATTLQIK